MISNIEWGLYVWSILCQNDNNESYIGGGI